MNKQSTGKQRAVLVRPGNDGKTPVLISLDDVMDNLLNGQMSSVSKMIDELDPFQAAVEDPGRIVAKSEVGNATISTVLLFAAIVEEGKPAMVFETAVFKNGNQNLDVVRERYATWADAVVGHERWVKDEQAKQRVN